LVFYDNVWWREHVLRIQGVERETQLFGKIINVSEDHFYFHDDSSDFRIDSLGMPKVRKAMYGETVVHVISRGDGTFEGLDYHNYDYNYVLYVISFVAFVIFLVLFFREWKLTFRGFKDA